MRSRCQYSHSQVWTRRPPYYASPSFRHDRLEATHREPLLRYLPVPCEYLLIENGKVVKVTCQRGVNCPFAHSPEEIAYHPLVYKVGSGWCSFLLDLLSSDQRRKQQFQFSLLSPLLLHAPQTQPCKAFAQRACRVYYCWKSHGEKERREVNKGVSLGIVKGLDVPINYPGATLVELLPNKGGRRRRQRSVPSVVAGLLGSSNGSKSASLRGAGAHKGSQLLGHLVRQFTECPENVEAPCPMEDGFGGDVQKACEEPGNNEPPLASFLRLFDNQLDLQMYPVEARVFTPQGGGDRSPLKKNAFKQPSRRESFFSSGGHAVQQQQSLPEPLGEELPLRHSAEMMMSEQRQQKAGCLMLNEHVEFGGAARCQGRRGNGAYEPLNPSSYARSGLAFPSISPLRSGNSHLNLFAGLDDFLGKGTPHSDDAFDQYTVQHLHRATSGNNPLWNDDRDLSVVEGVDEGFDPPSDSWGSPSSAQSSFADTVRCSSWSTRPSQSSSTNTKMSLLELVRAAFSHVNECQKKTAMSLFYCLQFFQSPSLPGIRMSSLLRSLYAPAVFLLQDQWTADDLKGGNTVNDGMDGHGSGGCGEGRGGSFSPGYFFLEGSPGAGRAYRCLQRDLRFSSSVRSSYEELPLLTVDREGECCSEELGERGGFCQTASNGRTFQLKASPSQKSVDITDSSNCDLNGITAAKAVEAIQEAEGSNKLLMSCFMPFFKKGSHGEVEEGGPHKVGSPLMASCEAPLQADDAANYYSQLLTLWNTAKHGHSFSAGSTESTQEQHSSGRHTHAAFAACMRRWTLAYEVAWSSGLLECGRRFTEQQPESAAKIAAAGVGLRAAAVNVFSQQGLPE
ncbi:hypothetical protein Esti_004693 [Eimeria stiedai]